MISFKPGYRVEADKWSLDGEKITSPERLAAIKQVLEKDGPVLVEPRSPWARLAVSIRAAKESAAGMSSANHRPGPS